mgnify:CR=1 FL=1
MIGLEGSIQKNDLKIWGEDDPQYKYVSETIDNNGNAFESSATPYDVFDKTYGNDNNVKMYPGFTAGIRF